MTTLNRSCRKTNAKPQILFQISTHKPNKVAKTPFESLKYTDHLLTVGQKVFAARALISIHECDKETDHAWEKCVAIGVIDCAARSKDSA